jgi:hypothetical protein
MSQGVRQSERRKMEFREVEFLPTCNSALELISMAFVEARAARAFRA